MTKRPHQALEDSSTPPSKTPRSSGMSSSILSCDETVNTSSSIARSVGASSSSSPPLALERAKDGTPEGASAAESREQNVAQTEDISDPSASKNGHDKLEASQSPPLLSMIVQRILADYKDAINKVEKHLVNTVRKAVFAYHSALSKGREIDKHLLEGTFPKTMVVKVGGLLSFADDDSSDEAVAFRQHLFDAKVLLLKVQRKKYKAVQDEALVKWTHPSYKPIAEELMSEAMKSVLAVHPIAGQYAIEYASVFAAVKATDAISAAHEAVNKKHAAAEAKKAHLLEVEAATADLVKPISQVINEAVDRKLEKLKPKLQTVNQKQEPKKKPTSKPKPAPKPSPKPTPKPSPTPKPKQAPKKKPNSKKTKNVK
eukprot:Rmarinus@m.16772